MEGLKGNGSGRDIFNGFDGLVIGVGSGDCRFIEMVLLNAGGKNIMRRGGKSRLLNPFSGDKKNPNMCMWDEFFFIFLIWQ